MVTKLKTQTTKSKRCLTCDDAAFARGLCARCYQAARSKIRHEQTTEQKLIDARLLLPSRQQGRRGESGFAKAFEAARRKVSGGRK